MEEVESAVHKDPDLLAPNRLRRAWLQLQLGTERDHPSLRLLELGSHQVRLRLLPPAVCDVAYGQRGREHC